MRCPKGECHPQPSLNCVSPKDASLDAHAFGICVCGRSTGETVVLATLGTS